MEESRRRYFSHAWALLTRDGGWVKPILVLALALFVPFVGILAMMGYGMEWARLAAWNVDAAPKQRNVQVGACIASGWRAFVVGFVWYLALGCVVGLVDAALPLAGRSYLADLVKWVVFALYGLVVLAAEVRAAVYGRAAAGLMPHRVVEMVCRDPKGLFKLVWITVAGRLVSVAVAVIAIIAVLAVGGDSILSAAYLFGLQMSSAVPFDLSHRLVAAALDMVAAALPIVLVAVYVSFVFSVAQSLLTSQSVGLWMRQFDVASWGGPSDQLPARSDGDAPSDGPASAAGAHDAPGSPDAAPFVAEPASPVMPADPEPSPQPGPVRPEGPEPVAGHEQAAESEHERVREPIPLPPVSTEQTAGPAASEPGAPEPAASEPLAPEPTAPEPAAPQADEGEAPQVASSEETAACEQATEGVPSRDATTTGQPGAADPRDDR